MNKSCTNCRHATRKPPLNAACSVKRVSEAMKMKYNGEGHSYCKAFKPYKVPHMKTF
ncbi:unnamed protein product, partial [marine sediment metagenome]